MCHLGMWRQGMSQLDIADKSKQQPVIAKVIWAAVLVLFANLAFLCADPFRRIAAADLPSQHTWEWWRTKSFEKAPAAPDVVLLGSSLVMIPVSVLDADYLNKDLDAVHHPQSVYMQDRLSQLGMRNLSCMNFGLPGGMISDDYMVARALFTEHKKPKVIVLGITLRDFIEGHVIYPASTVTFKYFKQFFDTDSLLSAAMPEWWQRAEYYWDKTFVLSGKRLEVQLASSDFMLDALHPVLSPITLANPVDARETNKNLAAKLKSVAEEGDFVMHPHETLPYDDNTREYKSRFRSPNHKLFANESVFLNNLLQLANQENIKVVVANMPLTAANMALMPPGSYEQYMTQARQSAAAHGCVFLDLNDQKQFALSDFRDTAHMNALGGRKFIDAVANCIATNVPLKTALTADKVIGKTAKGPISNLVIAGNAAKGTH